MGDSFRMYLRDTHVIQDQHREALGASSEEVMDLVSALPADIDTSIDNTAWAFRKHTTKYQKPHQEQL